MNAATHLPPEALDEWLAAAAAELGVDAAVIDTATVLNVARDVSHLVVRPAAPLSTFLLGLAVGSAEDPAAALNENAERLTALAEGWEASTTQ